MINSQDNPLLQVLTKGLEASLSGTEVIEGTIRITTDTGRLFLDTATEHFPISNVVIGMSEAEILALQNPLKKLYVADDTLRVFASDGTDMRDISEVIPVETTSNESMYMWMSPENATAPKYNSALTFNPSTKAIRLGNMQITKTVSNNQNIIDFAIVEATPSNNQS